MDALFAAMCARLPRGQACLQMNAQKICQGEIGTRVAPFVV
jgi:hypothetical protein